MTLFLQRQMKRIVALILIAASYAFARLPAPTATERARVAERFRFEPRLLGESLTGGHQTVRAVHPSLGRLNAWVSAVGAAVALNDLDGDGDPNDACLVDPRTDRVHVLPVTQLQRYAPFTLPVPADGFDPATVAPMGCTPADVNEDGRQDLIVYFWGRTPLIYLRRDGRLDADAYRPERVLDGNERWFTNAIARADLDGDGHVDLVVANYYPDGARILDPRGKGTEVLQASMSRAANGGRKHVFLWAGLRGGDPASVAFRRIDDALPPETSGSWTLALGAADLDQDMRPELYFANDFGPDHLLHNVSSPGHLKFTLLHGRREATLPRSKTLGADSFKGMGVDFADLNVDGRTDIYVSNIAAPYALQESHFLFVGNGRTDAMRRGIAPFRDESERLGLSRSGWAWDAKLDDFDNDGQMEALQATGFIHGEASKWPELHELATGNDQLLPSPLSWPLFQPGADLSGSDRNPFFVKFSDGRFYDIAEELGFGRGTISRGIAIADVDSDGRLDIAVANQWRPSTFFANRAPNAGAYLGLRLLLPLRAGDPFTLLGGRPGWASGTPAIGAVVRVRLPDGRVLVREIDAGNGHSGKRSTELHFGLGAVSRHRPLDVEVRWRARDGRVHVRPLRVTTGWYTVILGEWAD
jgi:enediyne biosynthesis protein E4